MIIFPNPRENKEDLTSHAISSQLSTHWLGKTYIFKPITTSTQNDVLQYASQFPQGGLVVAADLQTLGRGQRGRTWHTFSQSALSFSFCLPYENLSTESQHFPYQVARIVADTLAKNLPQRTLVPEVVFPNDIILSGKKIAGILVERKGPWLIVGMGMNVHTPQDVLDSVSLTQATSVYAASGLRISRSDLLLQLLCNLEKRLVIQDRKKVGFGCGC